MLSQFESAESTIERAIARGRKQAATPHERWLTWSLLHNTSFRQRLTDQLARRA